MELFNRTWGDVVAGDKVTEFQGDPPHVIESITRTAESSSVYFKRVDGGGRLRKACHQVYSIERSEAKGVPLAKVEIDLDKLGAARHAAQELLYAVVMARDIEGQDWLAPDLRDKLIERTRHHWADLKVLMEAAGF